MRFKRFKRFRTWVRDELKELRVIAESVTPRIQSCHSTTERLESKLDPEIDALKDRVDHLEAIIKRTHESLDWERGRVVRASCGNSLGLKDGATITDGKTTVKMEVK